MALEQGRDVDVANYIAVHGQESPGDPRLSNGVGDPASAAQRGVLRNSGDVEGTEVQPIEGLRAVAEGQNYSSDTGGGEGLHHPVEERQAAHR